MQTGDQARVTVITGTTVSSGTLNNSGFRIDGSTVTVEWADNDNPTPGGETPGPGGPAGYDVFSFAITKTGNNS